MRGRRAQDRAVREPERDVHRLLAQGGGDAPALAAAGLKRLGEFLAVGVVLHRGRVGVGVVEHRAVGRYPGEAQAVAAAQGFEIVQAVGLDARGGEARLRGELGLLPGGKIAVQRAHDERDAGQHHGEGREEYGAKNAFCHVTPPSCSPRRARCR